MSDVRCYNRHGNEQRGPIPCALQAPDGDGPAHCCDPGWTCATNGLCVKNAGTSGHPYDYSPGYCTQQDWNATTCIDLCRDLWFYVRSCGTSGKFSCVRQSPRGEHGCADEDPELFFTTDHVELMDAFTTSSSSSSEEVQSSSSSSSTPSASSTPESSLSTTSTSTSSQPSGEPSGIESSGNSATSPPDSDNGGSGSGVSSGAVIGLGVGLGVLALITMVMGFFLFRYYRKSKMGSAHDPPPPGTGHYQGHNPAYSPAYSPAYKPPYSPSAQNELPSGAFPRATPQELPATGNYTGS